MPLQNSQKHCPEHGDPRLLPEKLWDRVTKLVYEPPRSYLDERLYPKAVCPGHPQCGVKSPERPTGLVEGDKYDTSVAAQVIAAKYGCHIPLYRQQDYFASLGCKPSRSTLYPSCAVHSMCWSH